LNQVPRSIACAAMLLLSGCTSLTPQRPPSCCAAVGYTRAQVESVLGKPSPPKSSRWQPMPSPGPNAAVYTTEHGYLTVRYTRAAGDATHLSLDFYEGKAPADAFRLASAYLPPDAVMLGDAQGKAGSARLYRSKRVAAHIPASQGFIEIVCAGPNPALLCNAVQITAR
jgi:hypothetical protein